MPLSPPPPLHFGAGERNQPTTTTSNAKNCKSWSRRRRSWQRKYYVVGVEIIGGDLPQSRTTNIEEPTFSWKQATQPTTDLLTPSLRLSFSPLFFLPTMNKSRGGPSRVWARVRVYCTIMPLLCKQRLLHNTFLHRFSQGVLLSMCVRARCVYSASLSASRCPLCLDYSATLSLSRPHISCRLYSKFQQNDCFLFLSPSLLFFRGRRRAIIRSPLPLHYNDSAWSAGTNPNRACLSLYVRAHVNNKSQSRPFPGCHIWSSPFFSPF